MRRDGTHELTVALRNQYWTASPAEKVQLLDVFYEATRASARVRRPTFVA